MSLAVHRKGAAGPAVETKAEGLVATSGDVELERPAKRQRTEAPPACSATRQRLCKAILSSFARWHDALPMSLTIRAELSALLAAGLASEAEPTPDRLSDLLPAGLVAIIFSFLPFVARARFASCSKALLARGQLPLAWPPVVDIPYFERIRVAGAIRVFGAFRPRSLRLSATRTSHESKAAAADTNLAKLLRAVGGQVHTLDCRLPLSDEHAALELLPLTALRVCVSSDAQSSGADLVALAELRLPLLQTLRVHGRPRSAGGSLAMEGMPALTALEFADEGAYFGGDLAQCGALSRLRSLRFTAQRSLAGLAAAVRLESLHLRLHNSPASKLSALSSLTLLTELAVSLRGGTSADALQIVATVARSMPALRSLTLRTPKPIKQLCDGVDLAALPPLRVLQLDCTLAATLPGLSSLRSLTELGLTDSWLTLNLPAVRHLTALETLRVHRRAPRKPDQMKSLFQKIGSACKSCASLRRLVAVNLPTDLPVSELSGRMVAEDSAEAVADLARRLRLPARVQLVAQPEPEEERRWGPMEVKMRADEPDELSE